MTNDEALAHLINSMEKLGASVFFLELSKTISWSIMIPAVTVKVIIPQLQPLFIDEHFRVVTGNRLSASGHIYQNPTHFFL
jgi:ribosomal protein S12 methylthiotransferase accessory factor YcaO